MVKTPKISCNVECLSKCCYFPRPGLHVNEKELENFIESVESDINSFEPEYREFIQKIVREGSFFENIATLGSLYQM